jgi:hypothetical protein
MLCIYRVLWKAFGIAIHELRREESFLRGWHWLSKSIISPFVVEREGSLHVITEADFFNLF